MVRSALPSRLTTIAQLSGLTEEIVELVNATIIVVEAAAVLARLVANTAQQAWRPTRVVVLVAVGKN
jgi:DNA topoisomerase VI subunit A